MKAITVILSVFIISFYANTALTLFENYINIKCCQEICYDNYSNDNKDTKSDTNNCNTDCNPFNTCNCFVGYTLPQKNEIEIINNTKFTFFILYKENSSEKHTITLLNPPRI